MKGGRHMRIKVHKQLSRATQNELERRRQERVRQLKERGEYMRRKGGAEI